MDENYKVALQCIISIFSIILMLFLIDKTLYIDNIKQYIFRRKMFMKMRFIDKRHEFENIYNTITNKMNMKKVKTEGIFNIFRVLRGYLIILLAVIIVALNRNQISEKIVNINELHIILGAIVFCIICFIVTFLSVNVSSKYKGEIIKNFLSEINPGIRCFNEKKEYLAFTIYNEADFKDNESDSKYITDYMEYDLDYTSKVKLADLHLQNYKRSRLSRHHDTYEVFEGIIVKITREKFIANEILIERNKFFKDKNRVKCENNEFEKIFDICAKDKNNIDGILTQNIKEQILDLYKNYGIMFEISIKGNHIFIRFFTGGLFEGIAFGTWWSKKKLYREYLIFTSILEIIEKINAIL